MGCELGRRDVGTGVGGGGVPAPATPDQHLPAGPDGAVAPTRRGGARPRQRPPQIGGRVIGGPVPQRLADYRPLRTRGQKGQPAPDDQFAARPDRGVVKPWARRAHVDERRPDVRGEVVAVSKAVCDPHAPTTPEEDLVVGEDCTMVLQRGGVLAETLSGRSPGVACRVKGGATRLPAVSCPTAADEHLAARPEGHVAGPRGGRAGGRERPPDARGGVVGRAIAQEAALSARPAPDEHFAARPDRRMALAGRERAGGGQGPPLPRGGVVCRPVVGEPGLAGSTPDDHF